VHSIRAIAQAQKLQNDKPGIPRLSVLTMAETTSAFLMQLTSFILRPTCSIYIVSNILCLLDTRSPSHRRYPYQHSRNVVRRKSVKKSDIRTLDWVVCNYWLVVLQAVAHLVSSQSSVGDLVCLICVFRDCFTSKSVNTAILAPAIIRLFRTSAVWNFYRFRLGFCWIRKRQFRHCAEADRHQREMPSMGKVWHGNTCN